MADDDDVTFTDEQAAFLRHVRFGELPARVQPEERVETVETDGRRDLPEPAEARVGFSATVTTAAMP